MRSTVFALLLALALAAPSARAVDGVVLINQSTVTAAGGFPYIISLPGSYKLSGPLTMSTTGTGNYQAGPYRYDIAIQINSNNVLLDLNGFSITMNNADPNLGHDYFAVASAVGTSQTSVKNGFINITSVAEMNPTSNNSSVGVFLLGSPMCSVEDLVVSLPLNNSFGYAVIVGRESLIRHNRLSAPAASGAECPSVIVENAGIGNQGAGCVSANNVP